jgi:predicted ArsR family transcriptional regulator
MTTDTSHEAYQQIASEAATLRRLCVEKLAEHGPMTADEIADRVGRGILSIRPRISELRKNDHVADTGERRKNLSGRTAVVWKLAA